MSGANLCEARLSEADLTGASLGKANLGDAYGEMVHSVYLAYLVRDEIERLAEGAITDAPE